MMIEGSVDPPCLSFQETMDVIVSWKATVKSTECQTEEPIDEQNDNQRKKSVSSLTCFHSKKF